MRKGFRYARKAFTDTITSEHKRPKPHGVSLGLGLLIALVMVTTVSCGITRKGDDTSQTKKESISWKDCSKTGEIPLTYANQFQIEKYGEYRLLTIAETNKRFLVVPEGSEVPTELETDMVAIKQPVENVYLVSSAAMDGICALDALSSIGLSGTKQEDWYLEKPREAMEKGQLSYAGKYNAPDYERILSSGCTLAIENTMLLHNPEVEEKLESMGISVLIERSSYETDPLGRVEWMKLYGSLFGKEDVASQLFDEQVATVEKVKNMSPTGQKVAYFYVTSNGAINVRKPNDYIAKLIGYAGGEYVIHDLPEEEKNALSTMNMQVEEFYRSAVDADVIIYSSTIDGEMYTIDELLKKNPLFADFKAVKNQQVYCSGKNFFQETTATATFVQELREVLEQKTDKEWKFFRKLD